MINKNAKLIFARTMVIGKYHVFFKVFRVNSNPITYRFNTTLPKKDKHDTKEYVKLPFPSSDIN